MNRLCDEEGRFSMLAIDQRRSLRRMIARHTGGTAEEVHDDDLRLVKRIVTEAIAPLSTAVLTDPIYGYPSTLGALPARAGVLLSAEVTGYATSGHHERRSRLIDGWSAEAALRRGADAVKLLIWHHPDVSAGTHAHQQAVVESVGEACAAAGLPFVLEVVTYALPGQDKRSADFARLKPELVIDGARTYSDIRFGVDLLKLEFPASLKYTQEYAASGFGTGIAVYDRAEVQAICRRLDAAAGTPWLILSAGVEPEEFTENIRLAGEAGASGFLCGRAVWQHVIDRFPHEARMKEYVNDAGRRNFRKILEANAGAKPWHRHRRFQEEAAGSDVGP